MKKKWAVIIIKGPYKGYTNVITGCFDLAGLFDKKCTSIKSLQIDRVDNDQGYTYSNIRSITMAENLWKLHNVDYQMEDPEADDYCPF